ncbi:MAG: tetratricopeptide repeat protein [Bacteroidales bacterium]|nr:tetratricopeptide repeat protein [Bacteroidales bacterium]
MMPKKSNNLISGFLSGNLSKKNKTRFLKKASTDRDFVKKLVREVDLDEVFEDEFGLGKDEDGELEKHIPVRIRFLFSFLAAAIFIGAIVVSVSLIDTKESRLFNKYYHPIEDSNLVSRGEPNSGITEVRIGLLLYYQENYIEAIRHLNNAASDTNNLEIVNLYLGLSYMGVENYEQAIGAFQTNKDDFYALEIKWYLGLCYLKTGQINKAVTSFELLTSSKGEFGKDSRTLVRKLR